VVFDDAAAEGSAVLVADEVFAGDAGAVGEPVVGSSLDVAMELLERTMELVGAGLGDQRDLPAGGAALVGTDASDRGAEFLHNREAPAEPS